MEAYEYDLMARVEERHWWFRARLEMVRTLLRKHVPPGVGLDCSCGTGMTLKNLHQWVQTGADLHGLALKHSRARGHSRLLQTDLRQLPLSNESLDLVVSLDTLEHIDEDRQALDEIFRVLKPGGHALFTVPAHPWMYSSHDRALHHVRRYRRGEFRSKVLDAHFEILKLKWINVLLFAPVAIVRLLSADDGDASSDTQTVPAAPLNWGLYHLFALERFFLWLPAPSGVSLVCLARKPPDC
jgi:SAM-dependent methyltransferase